MIKEIQERIKDFLTEAKERNKSKEEITDGITSIMFPYLEKAIQDYFNELSYCSIGENDKNLNELNEDFIEGMLESRRHQGLDLVCLEISKNL